MMALAILAEEGDCQRQEVAEKKRRERERNIDCYTERLRTTTGDDVKIEGEFLQVVL